MSMIAKVDPAKMTGHRMLNVLHAMLLLGAMVLMFALTGLLFGGLLGLGLALGCGSAESGIRARRQRKKRKLRLDSFGVARSKNLV
jgi:hypothetical protein